MLVNRAGTIEAQSGGFRIANAYPAGGAGEGNVYIDSGDANLSNNGIVASLALENQYSLKGAGSPAPDATDGNLINGRNTAPDTTRSSRARSARRSPRSEPAPTPWPV